MTSSSEARVPHDPNDLREAATVLRWTLVGPFAEGHPADRLEAWADDIERLAPLEAAVLDAAKDWAAWPDRAGCGTGLLDAVRALREATE